MKVPTRLPLPLVYLCFVVAIGVCNSARAGSATWDVSPASGDWNTATNWTPMTVPNGPTDTATFGLSDTTDIFISADTIAHGITFVPGSSAFTITVSPNPNPAPPYDVSVTLYGAGITNNSGSTQNFFITGRELFLNGNPKGASAQLVFRNSATAGSSTVFDTSGGNYTLAVYGTTIFADTSSADHGTFFNEGEKEGPPGATEFLDSSTAANGTFTNYPPKAMRVSATQATSLSLIPRPPATQRLTITASRYTT
jgi:hypothetical protein